MLAVGRPRNLTVPRRSKGELGGRTAHDVVHPDIRTLPDGHLVCEAFAVRREPWRIVGAGLSYEGRDLPRAVHPVDGIGAGSALAAQVDEGSGLRERKLTPANVRVCSHVFQQWSGGATQFPMISYGPSLSPTESDMMGSQSF